MAEQAQSGGSHGRTRKLKQPRAADMPRVLAELLREPKVALLHRVVRIAGPAVAWGLLKQTLKVQQQGGQPVNALGSGAPERLLVHDAQTQQAAPRQRTTGGVFFALLRDTVPRETYREIYEVEARKKKDVKKRVRYQKKQRFEREIDQLGFHVLHLDPQQSEQLQATATAKDRGAEVAAPVAPFALVRGDTSAEDAEEGEVDGMMELA
ncbi:hypothetical protein PybrP1_006198 [[Pythium] brassicae (nom. inval.)]|nr:hypothetical protein PybrP1_006198 [[Pythium] brassicae (nom. inval.)]